MKQITFILTLLITALSYAQTGSVKGIVTDKEFNDEPLPFANVLIKGTSIGVSSDMDGNYILSNIEPGTIDVEFSFVGYETIVKTVTVEADKEITLNISLGASAAQLNEVIIKATTSKETESALLLEQKKAVEIKQSIGAEELSRKGVSDAAGAVAKISGVSKQEGSSNVYVRGLGDRYLNTTMNGLSLPSNDVSKKNIDLNLFSSDIIQSVSISKAYASKYYADFSAGNVDITSKEHKGKTYLEAFSGSGFNTNAINKSFVRSEGTGFFGYYGRYAHNPFAVVLSHGIDPESVSTPVNVNYGLSFGKSFSFENGSKVSVFATGSFENGYEYRFGKAVDFSTVEKKAFEASEEYEYSTATTLMTTLAYKIDDNNNLKFVSLFNNSSSDEVGYFGIDGKGRNRDAILNTDEGFYQMNVQFDQTRMFVNQLLGNHKSGDLEVDWGFGYNKVLSNQPDRKRISVENYQLALDGDASTNPTFYSNVDFDNQRYFQNIEDDEYSGRVNLAYTINEKVKLNFGYNGRNKKRSFDNIRYGYDIQDNGYQITDLNNVNSFFNFSNISFDNNDSGYDISVINGIPTLGNSNLPGLPENTYTGKLNIYAGYTDAEIKAGDKWLFVPGIRLESFEQQIDYDVINLGNSGKDSRSFKETFFLPTINVKYSVNDTQNLRFSASQTVSVPEFKEVAPFVYEDVSTRIGGNPDVLGYSKILNIDLKYEWFFGKSELLSIGAFAKEISNPVNLVVVGDATGTQRYVRTGDKAKVYGIEAELRKNIIKDEDDNTQLSFGVNGTYMRTKQDLYQSIDGTFDLAFKKSSDELQGASPFIFNADISFSPTKFENYKPVANLVFSYFSDRIDALGSGDLGNIVEKGVPTLDFIWKNTIKKNFEINFSAKNLLNPKVQYVREDVSAGNVLVTSANGKGVTDYRRGLNIGLQLKYKF